MSYIFSVLLLKYLPCRWFFLSVKYQHIIICQNWLGWYWKCFLCQQAQCIIAFVAGFFVFVQQDSGRHQPSSRWAIRSIFREPECVIWLCILYPILKPDIFIQQTWNADSLSKAIGIINTTDKGYLWTALCLWNSGILRVMLCWLIF